MELNEYQKQAEQSAVYPASGTFGGVLYAVVALVGEAGEIANKTKKIMRDADGEIGELRRMELAKEMGDVLWYLAALAGELGITLEEIAQGNLDKVMKRKAEGKIKGDGDNR